MPPSDTTAVQCDAFSHDWREVYYGHECTKCGLFYAFGTAPWDAVVDEPTCDCCGIPLSELEDNDRA